MELSVSEKRGVWLKGALKGALKETVRGLAIGFVAAAAIYLIVPPLAAAISAALGVPSVMGGVISFVAPLGVFNPLPLMAFNSLISGAAGLFAGGGQAVAAHHQQKHNRRDEMKLVELDSHTQALEQTIMPSRHVQKILENGPRHQHDFKTAETLRAAEEKGPTIH